MERKRDLRCLFLLQDLRETIDKQAEQIRKLKKMLKIYAKKLKDGEGDFHLHCAIYTMLFTPLFTQCCLRCCLHSAIYTVSFTPLLFRQ